METFKGLFLPCYICSTSIFPAMLCSRRVHWSGEKKIGSSVKQLSLPASINTVMVLQLLGTLATFDRFECLGACQEYPGCYWFSSNEENGFCGLFETCEDVSTENCPQCVSGIMTSFQELFLLKSNH